ncbi:MAG: SIMPL domain-containing protein, partial [Candidatus Paceibacterota bacterium]
MDTNSFFSEWYVRMLVVLVFIGVIVALGAYTKLALREAEYSNIGPSTITVHGEGEVLARPDIGQFSFSVRAEGEDAVTAQEDSAAAINEITTYLTEAGVAESDIKTQNYNLNPRYRYEERICPQGSSFCPPGKQIVDGYEVSQMIEVKVRDLDTSGDLITGVGQRGATNISSIQFTIDDEENLKAEARDAAIQNAKAKADALAKSLGVRIVKIIGYYEDEGVYPMYGYGGDAMAMEESAMRSVAAPAMPVG